MSSLNPRFLGHPAHFYVRQSGGAVFADTTAAGNYTPIHIFDDLRSDQIAQIPLSQPHRRVDVELINADEEGT